MQQPLIIQGGMGAGVSNWFLAKTVSMLGQLGVVSGTALDTILVRRLQRGDPGGHIKRSLDRFPIPFIAQKIYEKYFVPNGIAPDEPFKHAPMFSMKSNKSLLQLTVVANFVEVDLAKEGHDGFIGINFLEKIQLPNLASIYGAMLAGVDYVLMGAGIPREIPKVLDDSVEHNPSSLRIQVESADGSNGVPITFDPKEVMGEIPGKLKRPNFLAIISSLVLAQTLKKKSSGEVNGFIVEGSVAGGHNAPPRGAMELNERGEPIYTEKDTVDLERLGQLNLPFWLAGAYGKPERVQEAIEQGAAGVQVGTPFALCNESGLEPEIKQKAIRKILDGDTDVFTDPLASPTGFPFKVFTMDGTISNKQEYEDRPRICDLGYLRTTFENKDGRYQARCPSEPVDIFLDKGGTVEETQGRKCLCNALMANIGLGQNQRSGYVEKPMLTIGDAVQLVLRYVNETKTSYSAAEVIQDLTSLVLASLEDEVPALQAAL